MNFSKRLEEATTKQEFLDLWMEYRQDKGRHLTVYEQYIILNRLWNGKSVDEVRESIAYTVSNGWKQLIDSRK